MTMLVCVGGSHDGKRYYATSERIAFPPKPRVSIDEMPLLVTDEPYCETYRKEIIAFDDVRREILVADNLTLKQAFAILIDNYGYIGGNP